MEKKIFLLVLFLSVSTVQMLAASQAIDFLRSTGKIYSVVAVIVIIFLGIILYLYSIDKKLTKLEKQINDEQ